MNFENPKPARLIGAVTVFVLLAVTALPASEPEPLTAQDRSDIVENLAAAIEEGYVSEAKGRDLAARLRQMAAGGAFTEDDGGELAEKLQRTLRDLSGDVHFRVSFGDVAGPASGPQRQMVRVPSSETETSAGGEQRRVVVPPGEGEPSTEGDRRMVRVPSGSPGAPAGGPIRIGGGEPGSDRSDRMSDLFATMAARYPDNYRAKILPGNVGLLEIDILFPPHDRLDSALTTLADTDALILDIRTCPGGTGMTSRALESVFFSETTELVTMAIRGQEPQPVMSTDDTPGGVKYLGKPVFVVTSRGTGSACEELAWCLKYHDKAIVVGETTGGAGHGITAIADLGHGFNATIPNMQPIHPNFEGGWEIIGVPPDVTIGSRSATDEAYLIALTAIMETADQIESQELRSIYASAALEVAQRQRGYAGEGRSLRSVSASFENGGRLHIKDGELYYTGEDDRLTGPLKPTGEKDRFESRRGIQTIILKLDRDDSGEIQSLSISTAGTDTWKRFDRVDPF